MAKTKEELNELKEEIETVSKKLCELTEEELEQVFGGEDLEHNYTVFACDRCGHEVWWPGTNYQCWGTYGINCENCGNKTFHWVRVVY